MNIIVKSNIKPKIGKKYLVYDKNKKKIGYVSDVIGPVNKPYILVKPFKQIQDNSELIGNSLFLQSFDKNKRRKRKMGK